MKKIIKSVLIFINSKIQILNLADKGFTLLEIILVITIIGILTASSFSFVRLFLDYFFEEESHLLSTTEEKIALLIFSNDLIQAKNVSLNENKLLFDSYHKGKKSHITYQIYNSTYGTALGKITEQNRSAVINNIKNINFLLKKDMLLVELLFIDNQNNTRNIKRVYNLRLK